MKIHWIDPGFRDPDEPQAPDPARFDPMAEPSWSLLMTVAWIVWRTPEAAREHWEAYRAAFFEPADGGRDLRRRSPSSLLRIGSDLLSRDGVSKQDAQRRRGEALTALQAELQREGGLRADGRRPGGSARVEIARLEWRDLKARDGRLGLEDTHLVDRGARAYEDVRFDREAVLRAFPVCEASLEAEGALADKAEPTTLDLEAPKRSIERKATATLAAVLSKDPYTTKAEARKALAAQGFTLSENGFRDRVWPAARKEAKLGPAKRGPRSQS